MHSEEYRSQLNRKLSRKLRRPADSTFSHAASPKPCFASCRPLCSHTYAESAESLLKTNCARTTHHQNRIREGSPAAQVFSRSEIEHNGFRTRSQYLDS